MPVSARQHFGPLINPVAAPAPLITGSFIRKGAAPLLCANEKHVSPFCATMILLQLLARPLWVGIAGLVLVDDMERGAFVVDTPT